ncbi:MAG: hypothetical protein KAS02_01235 [Candidatus Pacebacteria bacterium]|nr:hypothetical protein [Candidatus Paceibacterota bacterium]
MNEKLKIEINKYATQDQYIRNLSLKFPQIKELCSEVIFQDSISKKFVEKVLRKYSWPTISLVGEEASHNFWLLVQHMDKDIILQKEVLKLLKKAVEKNEADSKDLAYLEDRILIAEGKKQLYGTQFKIENGKLVMSPTEDLDNLEKRRNKMGLFDVETQLNELKKTYKNLLR